MNHSNSRGQGVSMVRYITSPKKPPLDNGGLDKSKPKQDKSTQNAFKNLLQNFNLTKCLFSQKMSFGILQYVDFCMH